MRSLLTLGFVVTLALSSSVFADPSTTTHSRSDYPSEWWEPFPRDQASSWEILPQDAGEGEVILSKRNELGLLSNFADTPFQFESKTYASLEGFWQAMKYPETSNDPRARFSNAWPHTRSEVEQMIGFAAKDAGSFGSDIMEQMNINWVSFNNSRMTYRTLERGDHFDLIRSAMMAKLEQNAEVRAILLKTGDLILRPDHNQGENTPPAWKYFEIWMEIRSELQKQTKDK